MTDTATTETLEELLGEIFEQPDELHRFLYCYPGAGRNFCDGLKYPNLCTPSEYRHSVARRLQSKGLVTELLFDRLSEISPGQATLIRTAARSCIITTTATQGTNSESRRSLGVTMLAVLLVGSGLASISLWDHSDHTSKPAVAPDSNDETRKYMQATMLGIDIVVLWSMKERSSEIISSVFDSARVKVGRESHELGLSTEIDELIDQLGFDKTDDSLQGFSSEIRREVAQKHPPEILSCFDFGYHLSARVVTCGAVLASGQESEIATKRSEPLGEIGTPPVSREILKLYGNDIENKLTAWNARFTENPATEVCASYIEDATGVFASLESS